MKPGFPMGGGNMKNIMKQAQKMQAEMQKKQAELEIKEYKASSGGGAVTCTLSNKQIQSLTINPDILDDAEMLQDLITSCVNDALSQNQKDEANTMGNLAGGLF